jgi:hypothetical protein
MLLLLQAYMAFVALQVRFLLFEAAQAETNAEWCVNGRPVETVQKLMIRRDALIQVRGGTASVRGTSAHHLGLRVGGWFVQLSVGLCS